MLPTYGPQPGNQELVMDMIGEVDFIIIGGSRFGGKSSLVSLMPLIFKDDPKYNGIVFRREFDQLLGGGGLWEMAGEYLPPFGAKSKLNPTPQYEFPSGAKVRFKHMHTEADAEKHRGLQYSQVTFEEITQFSKEQVQFLLTCLRSEADMDSFCIGTCNPDPDSWLLEVLDWYIDPETGLPIKERQAVIRYFIVNDGEFIFGPDEQYFIDNYYDNVHIILPDTGEELYVPAKRFTFVQLTIFDNPIGMKKNPRYISELQNLPDHEREMQLWGNWHAKPKGAKYFQREWLTGEQGERVIGALPPSAIKCWRGYDKAGTAVSDTNRYPDYTAASPKVYKCNQGYFYLVGDYISGFSDKVSERTGIPELGRFRKRSGERDSIIVQQALSDGENCISVLAQDSGSAGITEYENAAMMFIAEGLRVNKDPMPNNKTKHTKAQPFLSACENGLVFILEHTFSPKTLKMYYKELEGFDGQDSTSTKKDDWWDATASAFNAANKAKIHKVPKLPDINSPTQIANRNRPSSPLTP